MLYVKRCVEGSLGGAYVWALKDDDAHGAVVRATATSLRPE